MGSKSFTVICAKELSEALSLCEELVGLQPPMRITIQEELAKAYETQGRVAKAIALKTQLEEEKRARAWT